MNFHEFEVEVKVNILKYVDNPINLALTCKNWSKIAKDPYAKTEWLIEHYGKTHAMFHAIRLGPSFINIPVCQNLFAKKVIISRYFIQRLLMHFGSCDQKLIKLQVENNVQLYTSNFQRIIKFPWASDLPISVFVYLLEEGCNQLVHYNGESIPLKGNDMELFYFLTAGYHVIINIVPEILRKNLKLIKDLILKHKFIPFPPRPKELQLEMQNLLRFIPEQYPPKDGFENNRQLKIIARAILIHPELVNLWKKIGYYEICNDLNDLVMEGALLILFPSTLAPSWICPTINVVISRLSDLINLGFKLKYNIIIDSLHKAGHRLDEIGDVLWSAFRRILLNDFHAIEFYKEALNPERNLKNSEILKFLRSKFDNDEQIIISVVKQYFIEEKISDITLRKKLPIFSEKVYQYILNTYGNESELTLLCFDDIFTLRVYIDTAHDMDMSTYTYNSIISSFNLYVNGNVAFNPKHLDLLKKVTNLEIINKFFDFFLPTVFGTKNNKYKKRKLFLDDLALSWLEKLELIIQNNELNNNKLSENFKNSFLNFYTEVINLRQNKKKKSK